MQLILLTNIILSIGAIAGISVFASQVGDIYILTDTYGFYWFLSTFSLLTGIFGYAYHKVNYVKQQFPKSEYGIYGMSVVSLLFTVFWLAASASMTSVLRNCLQVKNLLYPEYLIDDKPIGSARYFNYSYNYTCNGQIITTTFGYSLFILWCVVSYLVAIKMFSKLKTTQNPESLEIKFTEQEAQQVQVQEAQQVQDQLVQQVQVQETEFEVRLAQQVQLQLEQVQETEFEVQLEQLQLELTLPYAIQVA